MGCTDEDCCPHCNIIDVSVDTDQISILIAQANHCTDAAESDTAFYSPVVLTTVEFKVLPPVQFKELPPF